LWRDQADMEAAFRMRDDRSVVPAAPQVGVF